MRAIAPQNQRRNNHGIQVLSHLRMARTNRCASGEGEVNIRRDFIVGIDMQGFVNGAQARCHYSKPGARRSGTDYSDPAHGVLGGIASKGVAPFGRPDGLSCVVTLRSFN